MICGMFHGIVADNLGMINLDIMEVFVKVLADVPGFIAAGFFGGMGGYLIRVLIKLFHTTFKIKEKDE
jgi:hypothetical protein